MHGSNRHILQGSETWPGAHGWMIQSHRVIPGRGVHQSPGSQNHFHLYRHPLELPLVIIRLWGWPGFILTCVGIQRKKRSRSMAPSRNWTEVRHSCPLRSYVTWAWPVRWLCLILRVWRKRKGQWSPFMATAVEWKVPSGVVTRVQRTRVQQQQDN